MMNTYSTANYNFAINPFTHTLHLFAALYHTSPNILLAQKQLGDGDLTADPLVSGQLATLEPHLPLSLFTMTTMTYQPGHQ